MRLSNCQSNSDIDFQNAVKLGMRFRVRQPKCLKLDAFDLLPVLGGSFGFKPLVKLRSLEVENRHAYQL